MSAPPVFLRVCARCLCVWLAMIAMSDVCACGKCTDSIDMLNLSFRCLKHQDEFQNLLEEHVKIRNLPEDNAEFQMLPEAPC